MDTTRYAIGVCAAFVVVSSAFAQDACKYRGDLDPQYCDENSDLTAANPPTIERLRYGAFFSSGQSCVLMSRILVPRSRHDASSPR